MKDRSDVPFDFFFEVRPHGSGSDRSYLSDVIKAFEMCEDCNQGNARIHWTDMRYAKTPLLGLWDFFKKIGHEHSIHELRDIMLDKKDALLWRLLHPTKSDTATKQIERILQVYHESVFPVVGFSGKRCQGPCKTQKQVLSNLPQDVADLLRKYLADAVVALRRCAKQSPELLFPRELLDYVGNSKGKGPAKASAREYMTRFRRELKWDAPTNAQEMSDLSLQSLVQMIRFWQMDAYLFARMFRTFRNVGSSMIDAVLTPTNIVVYAGDHHVRLYKEWLEALGFVKELVVRSRESNKEYQCMRVSTPLFPPSETASESTEVKEHRRKMAPNVGRVRHRDVEDVMTQVVEADPVFRKFVVEFVAGAYISPDWNDLSLKLARVAAESDKGIKLTALWLAGGGEDGGGDDRWEVSCRASSVRLSERVVEMVGSTNELKSMLEFLADKGAIKSIVDVNLGAAAIVFSDDEWPRRTWKHLTPNNLRTLETIMLVLAIETEDDLKRPDAVPYMLWDKVVDDGERVFFFDTSSRSDDWFLRSAGQRGSDLLTEGSHIFTDEDVLAMLWALRAQKLIRVLLLGAPPTY